MEKRIPKWVVAAAIGFVVLFLIIMLVVSVIDKMTELTDIKNDEDAKKAIERLMEKIDVKEGDPIKASVTLESNLYDELPSITEYPLSVEGYGKANIEIFATSEKSGNDKDGWINEMAEEFNRQGNKTSTGEEMSVSIRPMASGLGADYIISGKYLPQGFTPSNELFGELVVAQGGSVSMECEKLVGNVAGILLTQSVHNNIEKQYGEVNIGTIVKATADGVITMGYTNPLSSATGLNFLVSTLSFYDKNDLQSTAAVDGFSKFQANVPYVAYTTLQMRTSAKSGSFNGMIMEYQSYINDRDLNDNYEFIPFGNCHNNPLYSVGKLTTQQDETMKAFVEFCMSSESQNLAKTYGFNRLNDYKGDGIEYTGADLIGAQRLWKTNKDSGRDISAVFVADVSGSMDGEPLNLLKKSLTNGAQYINNNNRIGLVSYSTDVTVELEIDKFDLNQRAFFQGAVENLSANGSTASYDAIVVALDMLIKEKESNPNAKLMLFLLSDGEANVGASLDDIKAVLEYYQIPVYTISYGEYADTDAMEAVSAINEAASINATVEDVVYKMKSLFNAQM